MKSILIASMIALGAASAANAESFTFTATGNINDQLSVAGADGKPVQAIFLTGGSQISYASGAKTTSKNTCASQTALPGGIFQVLGLCSYTESNGDTVSILYGCNSTSKDQLEADCVAGLSGVSGSRKGKEGTMSWHQKITADGKTGVATGVGMWPD